MTNIILCGGSGTRLWPISRKLMPKQFVKLFDNKSLFQLTVQRNKNLCESGLIVSNTEQYFLALDQLEELTDNDYSFLLEPLGRNTAPAISLACLSVDKDEIILVTPSDHLIKNDLSYSEVVEKAKLFANDNYIVTFGIKPEYPETGYGYIQTDGYDVVSFKEKPTEEIAKEYVKNESFYWNSGMFCFKAGVFLDELKKYSPEIYNASLKAFNSANKKEMIRISYEDMSNIPENSIDYALLEKSNRIKIIPSDIGWSDVGSFDSLFLELPKDNDGNTKNENLISINSRNNLILTDKKTAIVDIDDLIIVNTYDALLVSKKGSSQRVKEVVKVLQHEGSLLMDVHTTVQRPWGTYTVLEDSNGYKIKKILVKPKKRLSLQKHYHRNEHWIVVSGTATVTVGSNTFMVRPNESTYIKMGELHRLENSGSIPLVLIEAQVGEYTGEDDIIRFDDDYKRV